MAARGVAFGPGDGYGGYRRKLVENLQDRGIRDLAVLAAVASVPRHLFVPDSVRHRAYEDAAVPIGGGQTISQPYTQALSIQELGLRGGEHVLEVGTGSGYQTALLARCCRFVTSIERLPPLAEAARGALAAAGIANVQVVTGDGTMGWRPGAPFDGIIVAAGGPDVPAPLVAQLREGAVMIVPVGERDQQTLMRVVRTADGVQTTPLGGARFVPLIGEHGHQA
jgi:protein-L-isoaspartate(D-aspartate) O-methyltransferase